jgi:chromosome segregation ATPase
MDDEDMDSTTEAQDLTPTSTSSVSINSLFAWVAQVSQDRDCCDDEEDADDLSMQRNVEYVASIAFFGCITEENSSVNGRDRILGAIQETFGSHVSQECAIHASVMAQTSLIRAVASPDATIRSFFVSHITQLDSRDQTNLMCIIQQGLQQLIYETTGSNAVDKGLPNREAVRSVESHSLNCDLCQSCREKDEQLSALHRELMDSLSRERVTDHKLKSELAVANTRLAEAEMRILEQEKYGSTCIAQLEDSKTRVREVEEQLQKQREKCVELEGLRDQLDMLKPLADRAEVNESQLQRLREKLEEFSNIRHQLKMESEALEETHAKLLLTETELDAHRKFKQQVDDYRLQLTESSIVIQDLTIRASKKDEMIADLRARLDRLEAGNTAHKETAQQLASELQATSEHLRDLESGSGVVNGIGSGLCEMNPILMQELHKLRSDNEMLASKLSSTSVDNLNQLETQIADQKCMNKSLQAKWMDTSDALKRANHRIDCLQHELLSLTIVKAQLQAEFRETDFMASEDSRSLKIRHVRHLQRVRRFSEAAMYILNEGKMSLITAYSKDVADVTEQLEHSKSECMDLTVECSQYKDNIVSLEHELVTERLDKKRQREEFEADADSLREQHARGLETEAEKQRLLGQQVEEEKMKKRKVEREKKIIEADLQRYKTQIQITSTGGSSSEIETAIKEMKVMRSQLEEAESEIKSLKAAAREISAGNQQVSVALTTAAGHEGSSRIGLSARSSRVAPNRALHDVGHAGHSNSGSGGYGFIDTAAATDITDKRLEQLQREKREIIARSLEENKERIEVSQKLMQSEREVGALKAKLTKVTLEKERMERKYNKAQLGGQYGADEGSENVVNGRC